MSIRIGINGFGRIGRLVMRSKYDLEQKDRPYAVTNPPHGKMRRAEFTRIALR